MIGVAVYGGLSVTIFHSVSSPFSGHCRVSSDLFAFQPSLVPVWCTAPLPPFASTDSHQIHDRRCGLWRSISHDFPLGFITFQPSLSRIFGSHRLSVLLPALSWSLQLKACCHSYFSAVTTSLYLPYPLPLIEVLALLLFKHLLDTQHTSTLSPSFLPIHANKQYNVAFAAPRRCQGPQSHRQYGL
jgi:hypothetical protein